MQGFCSFNTYSGFDIYIGRHYVYLFLFSVTDDGIVFIEMIKKRYADDICVWELVTSTPR